MPYCGLTAGFAGTPEPCLSDTVVIALVASIGTVAPVVLAVLIATAVLVVGTALKGTFTAALYR